MATYNWTSKGGMLKRYPNCEDLKYWPSDIFLPTTITGYAFTSLSGNDEIGDGSAKYPWKSISGTPNILPGNWYCILSSGVYRGMVNSPAHYTYFADGDVVIDNSIIGEDNITVRIYGIKFINGYVNFNLNQCRFCVLQVINASVNDTVFGNNIISSSGVIFIYSTPYRSVKITGYNTFVDCFKIAVASDINCIWNCGYFSIFDSCEIAFSNDIPDFDYSLFHNCTFSFNASEPIAINTLEDFINWADLVNPKDSRPGILHCKFADPKFNNPDIDDYSLAFDSPAKNLDYFGNYVGARTIGTPIKVKADENEGNFDFSTAVNVSVTDNSIMLINPEIDASIETKVIANLKGRELAEAPIFGFSADRNGQYIDSLADLSEITVSVGTSLKDLTPYIVEGASIILNGNIYQPGERFTTKDVLDFSSDGGGVCREILEAPQRHTIMARFSNGGASKSVGDPLVVGYWYYAISGTINYNGVEYFQKSFKAIDTNSFTTSDGGVLIEAFTNEEYQHYEPGIAFSSNNVGNVRTGQILRGNGDPDYIRGNGFEFPINARFIQLKYIIRVNNLKP